MNFSGLITLRMAVNGSSTKVFPQPLGTIPSFPEERVLLGHQFIRSKGGNSDGKAEVAHGKGVLRSSC